MTAIITSITGLTQLFYANLTSNWLMQWKLKNIDYIIDSNKIYILYVDYWLTLMDTDRFNYFEYLILFFIQKFSFQAFSVPNLMKFYKHILYIKKVQIYKIWLQYLDSNKNISILYMAAIRYICSIRLAPTYLQHAVIISKCTIFHLNNSYTKELVCITWLDRLPYWCWIRIYILYMKRNVWRCLAIFRSNLKYFLQKYNDRKSLKKH